MIKFDLANFDQHKLQFFNKCFPLKTTYKHIEAKGRVQEIEN
jgi:hypothetical protein